MPPISVLTIEDDSDDNSNIPSFNSNGISNTPQSSRARMLAQQREIRLEKNGNQHYRVEVELPQSNKK